MKKNYLEEKRNNPLLEGFIWGVKECFKTVLILSLCLGFMAFFYWLLK